MGILLTPEMVGKEFAYLLTTHEPREPECDGFFVTVPLTTRHMVMTIQDYSREVLEAEVERMVHAIGPVAFIQMEPSLTGSGWAIRISGRPITQTAKRPVHPNLRTLCRKPASD